MGHKVTKSQEDRYINMNICRARAGLLHVTIWILLILLLNTNYSLLPAIYVLFWDFSTAAIFELTPLSPTGLGGC